MSVLYDRAILRLAAGVAEHPMLSPPALHGEARSRVCASTLAMTVRLADGAIAAIGVDPRACAIGQAAATLFARHAVGADRAGVAAGLAQVDAWLAGSDAALPFGFDALAAVRPYPGRHGALRLPFYAALSAMPC